MTGSRGYFDLHGGHPWLSGFLGVLRIGLHTEIWQTCYGGVGISLMSCMALASTRVSKNVCSRVEKTSNEQAGLSWIALTFVAFIIS